MEINLKEIAEKLKDRELFPEHNQRTKDVLAKTNNLEILTGRRKATFDDYIKTYQVKDLAGQWLYMSKRSYEDIENLKRLNPDMTIFPGLLIRNIYVSLETRILHFLPETETCTQIPENEKPRFKCLLCGRKNFTHKSAHQCSGGYRKRKIVWEEILYADKAQQEKLNMKLQDLKDLGVKEIDVQNKNGFPVNPHTLMKGISIECERHNKIFWDFNKKMFEFCLNAPETENGVYSIDDFYEANYNELHIARTGIFQLEKPVAQVVIVDDKSWIEFETSDNNQFYLENQGDYLCIALEDSSSGCQYLTVEQAIKLKEWFSKQTFEQN